MVTASLTSSQELWCQHRTNLVNTPAWTGSPKTLLLVKELQADNGCQDSVCFLQEWSPWEVAHPTVTAHEHLGNTHYTQIFLKNVNLEGRLVGEGSERSWRGMGGGIDEKNKHTGRGYLNHTEH